MVPMRDGIRLHTLVFTPTGAARCAPDHVHSHAIWHQRRRATSSRRRSRSSPPTATSSPSKTFVGATPLKGSSSCSAPRATTARTRTGVDESTDAYDTIDWLVKQIPNNNGRVRHDPACPTPDGAHGHGDARPASRAQSCLSPGLAGRHVSRRRLSSQRRVPPELRLPSTRSVWRRATGTAAVRPSTGTTPYDWYLHAGALSNFNTRYLHDKRSRRGTISLRTRTTISSGSDRRRSRI